MKKTIYLRTVVVIFVLFFAISGTVFAQSFDENVMFTPDKTITPGQSSILSVAATKVLRHISEARAEIHQNKLDRAKMELVQAERMLAFIDSVRPTEKVRDQIWIAGNQLAYKSEQEVAVNLIPIYTSLDEISGIISVEKAKKHIDKAKGYLEQKNKKGAKQELEEADKALIFTEIDMPLASTNKYVKEAQGYLQKGNARKADEALDAAEDGVQSISIGAYGPVAQANRGYWAASKKYVAGKYAAAKEELELAKNYAQKALTSADKEVKNKASKLLEDINNLEKKIAKQMNSPLSY
jgi:hypothetical protein